MNAFSYLRDLMLKNHHHSLDGVTAVFAEPFFISSDINCAVSLFLNFRLYQTQILYKIILHLLTLINHICHFCIKALLKKQVLITVIFHPLFLKSILLRKLCFPFSIESFCTMLLNVMSP